MPIKKFKFILLCSLFANMRGFEEIEEDQFVKNWVIIALILVIILLTVVFESITSAIFHWIEKQKLYTLENLLKAVFKELTILGFISLLLFTTGQSGLTQEINDRIFGQSLTEKAAIEHALQEKEAVVPQTLLQEIFEDVHIFIFIIMIMYIIETAILLMIGGRALSALTSLDYETRKSFTRKLADIKKENKKLGVPYYWQKILVFYVLRERFMNPRIPCFAKPKKGNFPFSMYLSENYSNCLVHMVELPVTSLLFVLGLCFFMRPFMMLQGLPFLYLMVFLAFGLLVITVLIEAIIHRAYNALLPDMERLDDYLINNQKSFESLSSMTSPTQSFNPWDFKEDLLEAPIDKQPVYSKSIFGIRNRIEKRICGMKMKWFSQCLQTVLFLNAAFLALVIHDAWSLVTVESDLWWKHKVWSYPLTVGIVLLNIVAWSGLIQKFVYLTCLDCNIKPKIIIQIEEIMEKEAMKRNGKFLQILLHAAQRGQSEPSDERIHADMERVTLQFQKLPKETRNIITHIFVTVSQHSNRLGEVEVGGVVTKSNVKEGLRLMGWKVDHLNSFIMGSWFDKQDTTHEGFLTFTGFIQVIMLSTPLGDDAFKEEAETRLERHAQIRDLFERLDENHDGELSVNEIFKILQDLDIPLSQADVSLFVNELAQGEKTIKYTQLIDFVDYMALTIQSHGSSKPKSDLFI